MEKNAENELLPIYEVLSISDLFLHMFDINVAPKTYKSGKYRTTAINDLADVFFFYNLRGTCKAIKELCDKFSGKAKMPRKVDKRNVFNMTCALGYLTPVKRMMSKGHKFDDFSSTEIIRGGDVAMLKFMLDNGQQITGKERVLFDSVTSGNIEMVDQILKLGYTWPKVISNQPVHYLPTNNAAFFGHVQILEHLHKLGCPITSEATRVACENGNFDCLKYAIANGVEIHPSCMKLSVTMRSSKCIKLLRENNQPWDPYLCVMAVTEGSLSILKFLHENGCPWTSGVVTVARKLGRIDCLNYAIQNGCPTE